MVVEDAECFPSRFPCCCYPEKVGRFSFVYSSQHPYIFSLVYTNLRTWTCNSSANRDLMAPFALLLRTELCSCFDD